MSVIASKLKAFKGLSSGLSQVSVTDGQMLFTTDTDKLYFDSINGENPVSRHVVNPNPDWNAVSGNAAILNKPDFVTNVTVTDGQLIVSKASDGANDPAAFSMNTTTTATVANGRFIKAGMIGYFVMNQYHITSLAAGASATIATAPEGFEPTFESAKPALTDSAQLFDSLIILFDPENDAVKVKNISAFSAEDINLLATTYEYVSDTESSVEENED